MGKNIKKGVKINGRELKKIVIEKYSNVSALAKKLGVGSSTVNAWISRGAVYDENTLNRICEELEISTDRLINGAENFIPFYKRLNKALIEERLEKSNYSRLEMCNIVGIRTNNLNDYYGGYRSISEEKVEKLALFLHTKKEDLFLSEENNNIQTENTLVKNDKDIIVEGKENADKVFEFINIDDKNRFTENIVIVNNNLAFINGRCDYLDKKLNGLQEHIEKYIDEKISALSKDIIDFITKMVENKKTEVLPTTNKTNEDTLNNKVENKTEDKTEVKIKSYMNVPTIEEVKKICSVRVGANNFNEYNKEINKLIRFIANREHKNYGEVTKEVLDKMNNVYGVNANEMAKTFYKIHLRKHSSICELMFEDVAIRSVYFNIICDMALN